ncbi:hypothetical protein MN608_01268 [Microdochium nivale]|nr:hypothetical protein MN608_01268 [Microdochium nivale]
MCGSDVRSPILTCARPASESCPSSIFSTAPNPPAACHSRPLGLDTAIDLDIDPDFDLETCASSLRPASGPAVPQSRTHSVADGASREPPPLLPSPTVLLDP